jgi:hypothetical protein
MHSGETLDVTAKKPDFTTIICPKTFKILCSMVRQAPRRSMSTICLILSTRQNSLSHVSVLRDYDTLSPAIPHSPGYVAGYP